MNRYLEKIAESLPYRDRVEVVIIKDGKILVMKCKNEETGDEWYAFPGGGVDGQGEAEAAENECLEEVGIKVENLKATKLTFKEEGGMSKKDDRHLKYRGSKTRWYTADYKEMDRSKLGDDGDSRKYRWLSPQEALQAVKSGRGISHPRQEVIRSLKGSNRVLEKAAALAVIVKGNPKYLEDSKVKPMAEEFYSNLSAILKKKGYDVEFDDGKPYTQPRDGADVWVGHSRGIDRLRFAPESVKTIALDTNNNESGYDPAHYQLSKKDLENLEKIATDLEDKFQPDLTPDQMKRLGVLAKQYFHKDPKEANYFHVDASLSKWPKNWVDGKTAPHGWFEWYSKYSKGVRTPDDERQIKRWISFKARHLAQLKKADPTLTDLSIQPRRRQALLNWGIAPGITPPEV